MLNYLLWGMGLLLGPIALLVLGLLIFSWTSPVFGGKPSASTQARMKASAHYDAGVFHNLEETRMNTNPDGRMTTLRAIYSLLFLSAERKPQAALPSKSRDTFTLNDGEMVWLGHSTLLLATQGMTLITDPVFYRASPLPLGGAPFEQTSPITTEQLPTLDIVLISHDHYDHLDMRTIEEIEHKVKQFLVPLGVKAHLTRWGVAPEKVQEFDWYEAVNQQGVELVFAPSRHFSGRTFSGRDQTLWGSWIVRSDALNLYFSGDSGYSAEFKTIGEQYGPFDITLMENGAYDPDWAEIHMLPEESVQAALDVRAERVLPIHWGKFDLARHHWREPIERFQAAAQAHDLPVVTPHMGEVFTLDNPPQHQWWLSKQ